MFPALSRPVRMLFGPCLLACMQACTAADNAITLPPPAVDIKASAVQGPQIAVFAGGCFWGV